MCYTDTGVATLGCIPNLLNNLVTLLFGLVGIVAVIFVIYGGAKFVLSGGDEKQVEGARKTITYALIGLVVVILAFAIVNFISYITGVGCIKQLGIGTCL
jgi:hypothetical protein